MEADVADGGIGLKVGGFVPEKQPSGHGGSGDAGNKEAQPPNLQLESHRYFHAVMNSDKANQRLHTAKRAKLLQLTSFHRQSINRCPLQCTMVLVTKEFKWDLERR